MLCVAGALATWAVVKWAFVSGHHALYCWYSSYMDTWQVGQIALANMDFGPDFQEAFVEQAFLESIRIVR